MSDDWDDLDEDGYGYCPDCGEEIGPQYGSHYHCGRCHDPKPTSMMGHGVKFDDGTYGLTCDPENLGKTWIDGKRTITDADIRSAAASDA